MARLAAGSCRRCATRSPTTAARWRADVQVTVRDHMMVAHSLRGEVFGPAQRAARRDVRRGRGVRAGPTSTPTASSSTSAGPPRRCTTSLAELNYRNLDDESSRSPGSTPRPRCWPARSPTGWPPASTTAALGVGAPATWRGSASPCTSRPSPGRATSARRDRSSSTSVAPGGDRRPRPAQRRQRLRPPGSRRAAARSAGPSWSTRSAATGRGPTWPTCARLALLLDGLPDGAVLLVDGLMASGGRLGPAGRARPGCRLVVLLHMPLGPGPAEETVLASAAAVVTTSEWARSQVRALVRPAGTCTPSAGHRPRRRSPPGPAPGRVAALRRRRPPRQGPRPAARGAGPARRPALDPASAPARSTSTPTTSPRSRPRCTPTGWERRVTFAGPLVGPRLDAAYERRRPGGAAVAERELRDGRDRGAGARAPGRRDPGRRRARGARPGAGRGAARAARGARRPGRAGRRPGPLDRRALPARPAPPRGRLATTGPARLGPARQPTSPTS